MKLLFITHETSRTGAPMVLLYLLKWLQVNMPEIIVDVLDLKKGDLCSEFKITCDTFYDYGKLVKPKKLGLFQKVFLKLGLFKKVDKKRELLKVLSDVNYNLVYSNTIVPIPLASNLVSINKDIKFIAHIHELDAIIKLGLPNFKDYIPSINKFITPSILVKNSLVNNWFVTENKVDVIYECTTVDERNKNLFDFKKDPVFTVGASGTVHWRKGHDLFLQLARYIKSNYPEIKIKFVWVGSISLVEQIIVEEDLKKLGLTNIVFFTGEVKEPSVYFNNFDVFVMTSREDPFPLVCIEIGLLGKPIICFKGATGTEEIIQKGGGYIVPYLSIEAMAEKVIFYHKNKDVKIAHGEINKIEFSKFLPQEICPQLFSVIQKVIST